MFASISKHGSNFSQLRKLETCANTTLGGAAMGMSSANLSLAYATGVTSRAVAMAAGAITAQTLSAAKEMRCRRIMQVS